AGFDLYKSQTDYRQATYSSDVTGATLRLGFPISEFSSVGLRYTYQITRVTPFSNAPLEIQLASGDTYGSIFGFTYGYNSLDDYRRPTTGMSFSLGQDFAGFGGNLKYVKTDADFAVYRPGFDGAIINSLSFHGGIIQGYDGTPVPINQRYFKGGDSFRGFALAGVGPRDLDAPLNTGAIGGNVFAIGTLSARLPSLLPESYGV